MSRLTRPAILLALLATLAAVLAACGGGSSDDPNKLLKETFSGDHKVKSGKLNVAVDVAAQGVQGLSQPVKIGVAFVSRSEAKRLLSGMERFKEVEVDFTGIGVVGQGFVAVAPSARSTKGSGGS